MYFIPTHENNKVFNPIIWLDEEILGGLDNTISEENEAIVTTTVEPPPPPVATTGVTMTGIVSNSPFSQKAACLNNVHL